MYIISIPSNSSKYNYVRNLLNLWQNIFGEYSFINCTESPLDGFEYLENDGIYYRELRTDESCQVNEHNYINSYEKDNLKEAGITLKEYIDMCLLFELDRIELIPKCQRNQIQMDHIVFDHVATILICPDGLDEIQMSGDEEVLSKLITLL